MTGPLSGGPRWVLRWGHAVTGRERVRAIRPGITVLGRAPDDEWGIRIDHETVARTHAAIELAGSTLTLRSLHPSAAVFVKGVLTNQAQLAAGDTIRLGNALIRLDLIHDSRTAASKNHPQRPEPPPGALFPVPAMPVIRPLGPSASSAGRGPLKGPVPRRPSQKRPTSAGVAIGLLTLLILVAGAFWPGQRSPNRGLQPEITLPARDVPKGPGKDAKTVPTLGQKLASEPVEDSPGSIEEAVQSVISLSGTRPGGSLVVGSGVMLTETGLAVTNAHVVSGTWDLVAKLYDGKRASVQPVRIDHDLDLALIRIPDRVGLRHVRFGSSAGLKIGETVFTVGSPLSDELSFTVTRGVVSSAGRLIAGRNFVQHDAAINPGCSGGPLLNSRGLLIGINTWKISQMQGLGFAIPVEDVKFFFERSSL